MNPSRVIIVQTAFLGDAILTIPLASALRAAYPGTRIAMVVTPAAATVLEGNADIDLLLPYDKHGNDRGVRGGRKIIRQIRDWDADLALVPHRSLRSALITRSAGIARRIGFTTSAGRFLFTDTVTPQHGAHEIDRNLDLLLPLGIRPQNRVLPTLRANARDRDFVDQLIQRQNGADRSPLIAVAPGSVWATKRWIPDGFVAVCRALVERGDRVFLLGGAEDGELCASIASRAGERVVSCAGILTLLQSAELIRRCKILLTNDSAPEHLAMAVGTPVVAIFGPTIPAFGFAPVGPFDEVVETAGLSCRPCGIHGGNACPIGTFDCMKLLRAEQVIAAIDRVLARANHSS